MYIKKKIPYSSTPANLYNLHLNQSIPQQSMEILCFLQQCIFACSNKFSFHDGLLHVQSLRTENQCGNPFPQALQSFTGVSIRFKKDNLRLSPFKTADNGIFKPFHLNFTQEITNSFLTKHKLLINLCFLLTYTEIV